MKPDRAFVAAGRAAQHCPELIRRGPAPADLLPRLALLGDRLARALGPEVAGLVGGEPPAVSALPPREVSENELAGEIGHLAANSLFASGVPGVSLLVSVEGLAVLRLVDRAFGGKGEVSGQLPEAFPLSAELLVARLEERLGQCLATALGRDGDGEVRALRRNARFAELAPFPAGCRLALLQLEVCESLAAAFKVSLALPTALLPRLLGEAGGASSGGAAPRGVANPAAAPFADVPLPLTARIVDMDVPLSAISALAPGMVLPVSVARAVPLLSGSIPLARGTVGEQDGSIALCISQLA